MTIARFAGLAGLVVSLGAGSAAHASAMGSVSTDRFGYSGTVLRYASLADAQNGVNSIDTISVGDRDLGLYIAQNDTVNADRNIMLGTWWYTMDTFYGPDPMTNEDRGRAGWGNTRGNTGVGYLQLFDTDASTDVSVDMSFGGFDGTFYRDFTLNASGVNANTADDSSRLSAIDNVNDAGIWHSWNINLTASGLEGQQIAPGIIESTNQPTDVTGTITGIFEITEDQTSPANQGFYAVQFDLSMINWAWDNRADLTPLVSLDGGATFFDGSFGDSVFRTVPTPGAAGLFGLAALAAARRRR